ncbi:ABC transporter substrate-binding protein [Phaeobacter sp. BS52]|uniref:ABC transporter substrate-binding protein n=1 Tax=Phaeobacter sp. BS52 TaxID=2907241 RepID=UPI00386AE433
MQIPKRLISRAHRLTRMFRRILTWHRIQKPSVTLSCWIWTCWKSPARWGHSTGLLPAHGLGDLEVPDTIPHVFKERPGVEGIMAMRPAVVIASNPRYNRLREQLEQLGVKTLLIDQSNPANEKVMHLASVLDMKEQGEKLSTMILSDYEAVASKLEEGAVRKLIHVSRYGSGGNFSVGGMETPVDNLIKRVGAENPAGAIGLNRYRRATQEGIIQMRPDAILFASVEIDIVGDLKNLWSDFPGLTYTPAGKHERIVLMRNMHVRADAASSGIATTALYDALQKMFP